ncbi:hypothetical protein F2P56_010861 [Juglans regia]|uniref:Uncharacterized protein LOC109002419 n=2 Tax=Juglans regia TaxID=51240 RepID=A0A2I4FVN1_JUGRE|nr:uncharacterized protein LOC109002419 [Juglans regia]KAF5470341.1 hypothetical protein F2P56_010861 [Juglans regia]
MDADICRWIAEFLLRNTVQDHAIKKLLQVLPVSTDSRFKKTVLLRTIQADISDASLTETTLDKLEMMEQYDRDDGIEISDLLKTAYCAVAVECAVKHLEGSPHGPGKYFEAVKRVFRDRVGDLERLGKSELVTSELRRLGDELEAAIGDANVAMRLLKVNTRNRALEAVRVYLEQAWALLDPPFLMLAAVLTEPSAVQTVDRTEGEPAAKNASNAGQHAIELTGKKMNGVEEVGLRTTNLDELATRMVNQVEEVAVGTPNAGMAAKPVNQVAKVAAGTPNVGDLAAKLVNGVGGELAAGNMPNASPDVGELTANTVNQVEEVAGNIPNANDLAVHTENRVEGELVVNTSSVDQDVGELGVKAANRVAMNTLNGDELAPKTVNQFEELVVRFSNPGQELRENDKPESCDGEGKRSVALPSGSWGSIIRDRAADGRENGIQRGYVLPRRKPAVWHKRSKGGVKITDTEEVDTNLSCSKYDSLRTPEVNKVREALKSSSLELQAVVKDPLPDALRFAETVISDKLTKDNEHEPSVENQSKRGGDPPNPSFKKSIEPAEINDCTCENQSCSHQGNAPQPSLMERNSTAHTYEWEDSIEDSPEGMTNHTSRLHLPSPRRKNVSPLQKFENENFPKRRKIKRWSLLEEDTLRTGVQKYGKGNWKLILNCYREIFEERTEVDLKDKWRNMTRS